MIPHHDTNETYNTDEFIEFQANNCLFDKLAFEKRGIHSLSFCGETTDIPLEQFENEPYFKFEHPLNLLEEVLPQFSENYLKFYEIQDEFIPSEKSKCIEHEDTKKIYKCDTKNLPKNFGKGILNFIQKNSRKVNPVLKMCKISYKKFINMVRQEKKSMKSIANLRDLWTDMTFGKAFRILSSMFFRKHCLAYIFNSKVNNVEAHLKYRNSLRKGLTKPDGFDHIKDD